MLMSAVAPQGERRRAFANQLPFPLRSIQPLFQRKHCESYNGIHYELSEIEIDHGCGNCEPLSYQQIAGLTKKFSSVTRRARTRVIIVVTKLKWVVDVECLFDPRPKGTIVVTATRT
jgi:hypothetical protein